jgi:fructose-bisphosphate aldolase class I
MDGAHPTAACAAATERTLRRVFAALAEQRVPLEEILLKPNMVVSGSLCPEQAGPEAVARATVACFRRVVPAAVPGIVFLSGGQSDVEATANLNAINALGENLPWQMSFSYGRALQAPPLKAWLGQAANRQKAQQAFFQRARLNGAARSGQYSAAMETG